MHVLCCANLTFGRFVSSRLRLCFRQAKILFALLLFLLRQCGCVPPFFVRVIAELTSRLYRASIGREQEGPERRRGILTAFPLSRFLSQNTTAAGLTDTSRGRLLHCGN